MKLSSAFAIYFLIWFLTLFAVLPVGVRTSQEAGVEPVAGEADSAPHQPMLRKKLVWTTLISALLFAIFWANFTYEWVTLEDFEGTILAGPSQQH